MSVFKTEAITLGRTDYSNSSQIITFYTRDYGKIHTIAKGFKRVSGRYSSKAIDLLTYYQILFIKKEYTSLHTLTEAVLQNNYPMLRNNLDNYYKASCMAELVNEFTEERIKVEDKSFIEKLKCVFRKPKTFITSDLHLDHTNIIKYCKRPFLNTAQKKE